MDDRCTVLRFNFQYKMRILEFFSSVEPETRKRFLEKQNVCDSGIYQWKVSKEEGNKRHMMLSGFQSSVIVYVSRFAFSHIS